ncbi:hypothetical protein XANCAGTX0491_004929 [Xanthoria calcicola]
MADAAIPRKVPSPIDTLYSSASESIDGFSNAHDHTANVEFLVEDNHHFASIMTTLLFHLRSSIPMWRNEPIHGSIHEKVTPPIVPLSSVPNPSRQIKLIDSTGDHPEQGEKGLHQIRHPVTAEDTGH